MLTCFLEFTLNAILVLQCFRSCCSYLHIYKKWLPLHHWTVVSIDWIGLSVLRHYIFYPPRDKCHTALSYRHTCIKHHLSVANVSVCVSSLSETSVLIAVNGWAHTENYLWQNITRLHQMCHAVDEAECCTFDGGNVSWSRNQRPASKQNCQTITQAHNDVYLSVSWHSNTAQCSAIRSQFTVDWTLLHWQQHQHP